MEKWREHQILWDWRCRQLWATTWCWELNLGPQEEQPLNLLTLEPSPQPPDFILKAAHSPAETLSCLLSKVLHLRFGQQRPRIHFHVWRGTSHLSYPSRMIPCCVPGGILPGWFQIPSWWVMSTPRSVCMCPLVGHTRLAGAHVVGLICYTHQLYSG